MAMRDLVELILDALGLGVVAVGVYLIAGLGVALIVAGGLTVLAVELNDMGRRR